MRRQRRVLTTLVAAQILGGLAIGSAVAVGGVLALQISGSTGVSGLAATMIALGAALFAVPLSRLAGRFGRRAGLSLGWLAAAAGSVLTLAAAVWSALPVLLIGLLLLGAGSATNLQSRFAAIDLAPAHKRGRHLSLVVWATTVGGVLGPNLAGPGQSLGVAVGIPAAAGPFLFTAVSSALAGVILLALLRPDSLLEAWATGQASEQPSVTEPEVADSGWRAVRRSALAGEAMVTVAGAHAVTIAVATMAPVALALRDVPLGVIGFVLSLHVGAMYGAAPVAGWLADAIGRRVAIRAGLVGMVVALLVIALAGDSLLVLGCGLVLLGVGWSVTTIAGATQLTESVALRDRVPVQGLSDLTMCTAAVVSSAASGLLLGWLGYAGLSLVGVGVLAVVFASITIGRNLHD